MSYKHYIEINANNFVTHYFSDAFEQPTNTSICINEKGGRHFHLELTNDYGEPKYKYLNNEFVEQTKPSLAYLKQQKLAELEQYHYKNIAVRTLTVNAVIPFSLNSKMRRLLQEQINYLGSTDKFNYYTDDGTKVVLTLAQLKKLHTKVMDIVNKNFQTYVQHKLAISRKKTSNSVANYNFKTNYLINQTFDL